MNKLILGWNAGYAAVLALAILAQQDVPSFRLKAEVIVGSGEKDSWVLGFVWEGLGGGGRTPSACAECNEESSTKVGVTDIAKQGPSHALGIRKS